MSRKDFEKRSLTVSPRRLVHWREHRDYWLGCKKCPLHLGAKRHVLYRGNLPCDLLILGEAPGNSEDLIGYPFSGPSGRILDSILADAFSSYLNPPTYCTGNLLACAPWWKNRVAGIKESNCLLRPPTEEEILTCLPRILDLLTLASPKGIMLVGTGAVSHYWKDIHPLLTESPPVVEIYHPSYIKKTGGKESHVYRKAVESLSMFVRRNYPFCKEKIGL